MKPFTLLTLIVCAMTWLTVEAAAPVLLQKLPTIKRVQTVKIPVEDKTAWWKQ